MHTIGTFNPDLVIITKFGKPLLQDCDVKIEYLSYLRRKKS